MNLNQQAAVPALIATGTASPGSPFLVEPTDIYGIIITYVTVWPSLYTGSDGFTLIADSSDNSYWTRHMDPAAPDVVISERVFIPLSEGEPYYSVATELDQVTFAIGGFYYAPFSYTVLFGPDE